MIRQVLSRILPDDQAKLSPPPVSLESEVASGLAKQVLAGLGELPVPPLPTFDEVASLENYERYQRGMARTYERRALLEAALSANQAPYSYPGYDACVRERAEFLIDFQYGATESSPGVLVPNYRERVVSSRSGLNCRLRATFLAIEHVANGRPLNELAIYATEQVTPFFNLLAKRCPNVIGSEYVGADIAPGQVVKGLRHEDVTKLSFADASLDMVVSNDVLEHVPGFDEAMVELARVLRPGGHLILTVPFLMQQRDHLIRARVAADGTIEHLLPPDYHGDPVNPEGGILCYQYFGWKLMDDLRAAGFTTARALLTWSYAHGLLGREQVVFWATK